MAASVEAYLTIIKKAHDGRLKLPAFQRDWKWKPSQVMLLLDSLRQGFPIGSFLFLQANPGIDLAPRDFRGSAENAGETVPEELVLDGQQRITAGLELFFSGATNHYFIDINQIGKLAKEANVDIDDKASIRKFLADLDAEDGYCKRLKASPNPKARLIDRKLLWTGLLLDDDELERAISDFCAVHKSDEKFMRLLIGRNFRPSADSNIPITTISGKTPIEAISRIFSTLNSTGKMLTPFELVVSILFPLQISLNDDVATFREKAPFYAKIDQTGDILLQTIALFDGKDTKKASLPKTISAQNYRKYGETSVNLLNDVAKLISEKMGIGLESSNELLVYPVIFTPLAYVWNEIEKSNLNHGMKAAAEQKIIRWFVGAVLSRRYQQSTHDKQARDKVEMTRWILSDGPAPDWIGQTYITNVRTADPDGAIGKLFRAFMNSGGLRDPLSNKRVGVGAETMPSAKHHIFPTRWVHHLAGWQKSTDSANLALNIMYVEESTNGRWLNLDPREQINEAISTLGSESLARGIYEKHGISGIGFEILRKSKKSREDFYSFIEERENYFANQLKNYDYFRPTGGRDAEELDDEDRG